MSTPNPLFPVMKVGLSWVPATENVDTTVPFDPSEVTGDTIGVRADGTAVPDAKTGDYPMKVALTGANITTESSLALIGALNLAPGDYWAAVRSTGPVASDWSSEAGFSIPAPLPQPKAPSGFSAS